MTIRTVMRKTTTGSPNLLGVIGNWQSELGLSTIVDHVLYRHMTSWAFLKDGAGILPASNMADPLRGTNLTATDVLVREAVQNSLDERRRDIDQPVRIRFDRRVLKGAHKMCFVKNLQLGVLSSRRERFRSSHNWFADGNLVLDKISDPDVGLPILLISDFNANGLGGRWNRRGSKDDRFFNLVLSIGGSLKWEEGTNSDDSVRSLGSYGYGKMAFAMASDIRTVIYYSTFRPDEGTNGISCRTMASAFLPPHSDNGIDFAGQAYFGKESGTENIPRQPLVDDEAHEWIRAIGLSERSTEDTGTTIVIPATRAQIRDLVECCETWWWPRLRESDPIRRVEFEFTDEGRTIIGCKPRSRDDLSPFLDCYKLVTSEMPGAGYELKNVKVRPGGQMRTAGRLVLKALGSSRSDDVSKTQFTSHIALVRDGLVIKYEDRFAHEDKPPVVGVFTPNTDTDTLRAFVLSEPPSHDEWAENAGRLQDKYAWGGNFLRLTKNRLRNLTRDFQTRQESLPDTESTNAAAFLRKTLNQLFRTPKSPPSPPTARLRAFTITTRNSGRRERGGFREDFAVFRIGLSEHASVESVSVDVMLSLKTLADTEARPADFLPCELTVPNTIIDENGRAMFTAILSRNNSIDVEASGRVHPCWKTQWEIAVVRSEK